MESLNYRPESRDTGAQTNAITLFAKHILIKHVYYYPHECCYSHSLKHLKITIVIGDICFATDPRKCLLSGDRLMKKVVLRILV